MRALRLSTRRRQRRSTIRGALGCHRLACDPAVASAWAIETARVSGSNGLVIRKVGSGRSPRSEEHTSELQSLMRISYAVFCLKKKKKTQQHNNKKLLRQ